MSVLEYKCPNCGGGLAFGSEAQKMKCPYCDGEFNLSDVEVYNASLQDDTTKDHWEKYEADSGSGSWTQEELDSLNVYTCPSCGGEIFADENTAATFCPYCENPAILPGRLADAFKPDLLIPFSQDKKAAQAAFLRLCKGKRLLPKNYTSQQGWKKSPVFTFPSGCMTEIRRAAPATAPPAPMCGRTANTITPEPITSC